jgi:S-(hydroxymethyl)glutathione dehydrogenase/alcohol dehydrogenase
MRAALLESANSALALVDDLDVAEPGAGLVRVRVHHCGLCHSDLTIIESTAPAQLPVVLGHEAAGVVVAVVPGVQSVKPGDHVVLVALAPCGRCYWCVRG